MSVSKVRRVGRGGIARDRWIIDVTINRPGHKPVRVQRIAREQNERGAQREERELIAAVHAGTWCAPRAAKSTTTTEAATSEPATFEAFASRWLQTYVATNNKINEQETKASILRLHLGPAFNTLKLAEVSLARIEAYKAQKLREQLSPKTINNHLTVLHKLLETARDWDELVVVPRVKWMKVPEKEARFLDFEEADALVRAASDRWRPLITFGLRTGLRVGEVMGLRWCDVDLKRGRIVVRQAISRGRVGTPKSGKSREVELSNQTVELLRSIRHLRGEHVFCREDGRALTNQTIKSALRSACRRAGLPMVHWHTLRHTFASHLVMLGAPMSAVQRLLGHSKINTTNRYAHLAPESKRDAVNLLDARVTPTLLRVSGSPETQSTAENLR
jgi:integrase